MFIAAQPAVVAEQQSDVIEIVGTRSDQTQKIDRRTYRVQQNPHSAQKDSLDLLRGLPAVTVSPNDELMLLGNAGVSIYVDGRPYQGDAKQYLKNLHGSDIERIEIITNPSAEYSAQGTAGIINFVLRTKRNNGLSGSTTAEVSGLGHNGLYASAKIKEGKWTYELEAHGASGESSRSSFWKRRSVEEQPGAAATTNTEKGHQSLRETSGELAGKVTYALDPRTSISAKLDAGLYRSTKSTVSRLVGVTPNFQSFTEEQRDHRASSLLIGQLNFDHKGSREGESLSAGLNIYGHPTTRDTGSVETSNEGAFSTDRLEHFFGIYGQADWQHPIGDKQILSVGGSWSRRQHIEYYRIATEENALSVGEASDQYRSVNDILSAYATLQQPIGTWTALPGVRLERSITEVGRPGGSTTRISRTNLFPTFHAEHRLSKSLDLTLSYSKRINRAEGEMLRPYMTAEDATTSIGGNPHLKDESTDAYEMNLHYHRGKVDAGLIVYDRETSRLWSTDYTVIEGTEVQSYVNSGNRTDRGAEFDVSMPVARHVKANASVNLFYEHGPPDVLAGSPENGLFRYSTNGTLEWDGPERGERPGDVAQVQWERQSPIQEFQTRHYALNRLSASYTHSFDRTVSLTCTLEYSGQVCQQFTAPLLQEYSAQRSPVNVMLKLQKTFGSS